MARKNFTTLQTEINTALADNNVGAITPAVLRGLEQDIIDTFQPAGGGLTGLPSAALSLTTADQKLAVFDTALPNLGQAGVITPNVANDDIASSLIGAHRMSFSSSVEGPNNATVIFTFYRDGVTTTIASEITTRGAGNPGEVTMEFPILGSTPGPHTFDVRVRAATGTPSVTFRNTIMTLTYIPGQ